MNPLHTADGLVTSLIIFEIIKTILIVQGIGGNWIWDDVGNNWNGNGDINNLRTLFVVEFLQFSLVEGSGDIRQQFLHHRRQSTQDRR